MVADNNMDDLFDSQSKGTRMYSAQSHPDVMVIAVDERAASQQLRDGFTRIGIARALVGQYRLSDETNCQRPVYKRQAEADATGCDTWIYWQSGSWIIGNELGSASAEVWVETEVEDIPQSGWLVRSGVTSESYELPITVEIFKPAMFSLMTPRPGSPEAVTPQAVTPQAVTPRAGTPRVVTPRVVTPRVVAPRVVTPRAGSPPPVAETNVHKAEADVSNDDILVQHSAGILALPGHCFTGFFRVLGGGAMLLCGGSVSKRGEESIGKIQDQDHVTTS
eukprot:TRINITY_DN85618_c0_g1_i1.p1 TRINITY_DN85618_c0_g1~~TRINITY_DN85618_c0_g1_i1.p1  ORF type:complete len:278 (-),score=49.68 TRINITY_DN85618_c0_g1_i1:473-1306(-)